MQVFALSLLATACGPALPPQPEVAARPPILLITASGLRADAVTAFKTPPARGAKAPASLTPHLDELAREAAWAGPTVAPSSATLPSLASVLTGLGPWQHQVLHRGRERLSPGLPTLAESLRALGYETAAYVSGTDLRRAQGFEQGFDLYHPFNRGGRATGHVASPAPQRFLWIHLAEPLLPYVHRPRFRSQVGRVPRQLSTQVTERELVVFQDPAVQPTPYQKARISALYRFSVAWLDDQIGRLMEALRSSGQWDESWVVFASVHGAELGEHGGFGQGHHLHREVLEVPLIVKAPRAFSRPVPGQRRPSLHSLPATLLEAVGGEAAPALAPSLFARPDRPALSELYRAHGENQFSLVAGDVQLLRRVPFSAAGAESTRALIAMTRGRAAAALEEPPRVIFARLSKAFAGTPPFHGRDDEPPFTELYRWIDEGTSEALDDERLLTDLQEVQETAWMHFLERERTPEQETRLWDQER